jgi:hypothetical protein
MRLSLQERRDGFLGSRPILPSRFPLFFNTLAGLELGLCPAGSKGLQKEGRMHGRAGERTQRGRTGRRRRAADIGPVAGPATIRPQGHVNTTPSGRINPATTTSQHRAFLGSLISTHRGTDRSGLRCVGRNVARPLVRATNMINVRGRGTHTYARLKANCCNGLFEPDSAGAVQLGHVGQNDMIAGL